MPINNKHTLQYTSINQQYELRSIRIHPLPRATIQPATLHYTIDRLQHILQQKY